MPKPEVYGPSLPQELDGAVWRTDGGFQASIRITNILQTANLQVTPVLFMEDGTEYVLPVVELKPTGVATVSINDALTHAPPEIAGHVSTFGSAALRFKWGWSSAVTGSIRSLDAARSLTSSNSFHTSMATDAATLARRSSGKHRVISRQKPRDMNPKTVTLESLWWKRVPEDGGFVALTNRSGDQLVATLKVFGSRGNGDFETRVLLPPHTPKPVI